MADAQSFLAEIKRRNVFRAAAIYAATVWALAQGIAQLGPSIGLPDWVTRWFLVAAIIGFPFWIVLAWFYEFTPHGLKRESGIDDRDPSFRRATGRKLDYTIIGILAVAVVLLATNQFVLRGDATSRAQANGFADIPAKSVAVLPLANASPDKDQVYFSDGLSEDLINTLSQFRPQGHQRAFLVPVPQHQRKRAGDRRQARRRAPGRRQRAARRRHGAHHRATGECRRWQHAVVRALRPTVQGPVRVAGCHYRSHRQGAASEAAAEHSNRQCRKSAARRQCRCLRRLPAWQVDWQQGHPRGQPGAGLSEGAG